MGRTGYTCRVSYPRLCDDWRHDSPINLLCSVPRCVPRSRPVAAFCKTRVIYAPELTTSMLTTGEKATLLSCNAWWAVATSVTLFRTVSQPHAVGRVSFLRALRRQRRWRCDGGGWRRMGGRVPGVSGVCRVPVALGADLSAGRHCCRLTCARVMSRTWRQRAAAVLTMRPSSCTSWHATCGPALTPSHIAADKP